VGGGGVLVVVEEVDSKQKQEDIFQENAVNEMG
jgi:hypothetical protein